MGDFCVKYVSDIPILYVHTYTLQRSTDEIWEEETLNFPMYINNN